MILISRSLDLILISSTILMLTILVLLSVHCHVSLNISVVTRVTWISSTVRRCWRRPQRPGIGTYGSTLRQRTSTWSMTPWSTSRNVSNATWRGSHWHSDRPKPCTTNVTIILFVGSLSVEGLRGDGDEDDEDDDFWPPCNRFPVLSIQITMLTYNKSFPFWKEVVKFIFFYI